MTKDELATYVADLGKQKNLSEAQIKKVVASITADDDDAKALASIIELPVGRQSDFSREMNSLKEKHTTLTNWHRDAKAAFDADKAAKAALEQTVTKYKTQFGDLPADGDGGNNPPARKPGGADTPDLDTLLNNRDQFYLRLQADLGRVRATHAKMFGGEIIDDSELLADVGKAANEPVPRQISVQQAYDARYGDRVKAENDRAATARDEKLRSEGAAAERKRLTAAGMRTSGANTRESSTLFSAIASDGDKKNEDRTRDPEANLSIFEQELEQALAKAEGAGAATT